MKISVARPTCNEPDNPFRLITEIGAALAPLDFEIVIASDNSPDGYWEKAEKIAPGNPGLQVIRRLKHRCCDPAVIEGFPAARGDYIACADADFYHDPRILPQLIAAPHDVAETSVLQLIRPWHVQA